MLTLRALLAHARLGACKDGSGRSRAGSHGGPRAAGAIRNRGGIALRMVLATVALALLVGAVFATLLITTEDARNAERSARHSQDVLIAANGLELLVLDLETGQRGFLLTRQMEFLAPWEQARAALTQKRLALLALVAGDPAQEARARKIIAAAHSYIDDYSAPLVHAAEQGDPSARTIAATAEGEARIKAIRADFSRLLETERRTSAATARARTDATHRAYIFSVVGIAGSIALLVLYAGYLARAIVRPIRRAATLTGRLAGGDLAARLPETGVGEIGALQCAFNDMGASLERSRDELAALADEQAGLRRVATLVAQGASADDVLAAVASEIGQLLPADYTLIGRYDVQGTEVTTVGSWSWDGNVAGLPTTMGVGGRNVFALVWQTRRPARIAPDVATSGPVAPYRRALGIRTAVGVPIHVEGRLWGIMWAASIHGEPMPDDTEIRLASFTELVSTAIANAEAQAALTASRARIVITADETRRRFERDLHDGAQQRFVAAALRVRAAQEAVPPDLPEVATELDQAAAELTGAIDALRDFAQGIHPAILAEGGLQPALRKLARHSTVPVDLDVRTNGRLPERVEVAAYYVVSEALTNAAKHGHASSVTVRVEAAGDLLRVAIQDDGVGGAQFGRGSGLVGLKDRVEALGGGITLQSEPAAGTSLTVELPLTDDAGADAA
jgi:signal transduction histidine kinase